MILQSVNDILCNCWYPRSSTKRERVVFSDAQIALAIHLYRLAKCLLPLEKLTNDCYILMIVLEFEVPTTARLTCYC